MRRGILTAPLLYILRRDNMNYNESLAYLDSLGKFGIKLGMERIEALLAALDNPQAKFKSVHVTGTNGKGSVSSMITNILLASNLKVGKFISPHLVKYNERISINGSDIPDDAFALALTAVKKAADDIVAKGVCEQPTQFEILTAAAFLHFALEKVDYAVIEVGMGGLWDSTNVITPVVSVITNVALDHCDRLGSTIERIAMQKAGIIKDNVPVVTAAEGDEALGPIRAVGMFKQAKVYIYGRAFWCEEKESTMDGQTFTLHAGDIYSSDYQIKLPGWHQAVNASLAIVAAKLVSKQDDRINELALHIGVANTLWPGRLERIAQKPDVILDGAHNPNGAEALRKALDKYYPSQKRVFVIGMMGDKDMQHVLHTIVRPMDLAYTVPADGGERAAKPEVLAQLIGANAAACSDVYEAYLKALAEAGEDGVVVICGSLYLVGTFKARLLAARDGGN